MSISINEEWEEIRARLVRSYFEDYPNVIPDSDPEDSWAGSSDRISPLTPGLDASPLTPSLYHLNSLPEDSWVKTSKKLLSSSTPEGSFPFTSTPDSTLLHKRPCSPLPELIIERVKEDPNKYDEPEEFYEQLAKDVKKYMKRLEKGDCSYSDFEREESQDLGDESDLDDESQNHSMTPEPQIERKRFYDDEIDSEVDDEVNDEVDVEVNNDVDVEAANEVNDEIDVEVNNKDVVEVDDKVNSEVNDEVGDEVDELVTDEVNDEVDDEGMQVDSEADLESEPSGRTVDVGVQCKIKDNRIGLFFSGAPTITKFCQCAKHDFLRRV